MKWRNRNSGSRNWQISANNRRRWRLAMAEENGGEEKSAMAA